ncbi:MAG: hypothetical protein M1483_02310 [Actinobacteria bacterium]|nr:hypothetical protein [Actinomycetota bacterium]MCL6104461.1 hypothetical protein [Actinomycetota bacterium]
MARTKGEITKTAKEAAYVAIGLGVLGYQQAQVRRQELLKRLNSNTSLVEQLDEVRDELKERVRKLDTKVETVINGLEVRLGPLEERLPAKAAKVVQQAHAQVRETRNQLRSLLGIAA